MLTHPETIRRALERAHGGHWLPQELQAHRDTLRHGQASLQRQVERLTEAYLAGVMGGGGQGSIGYADGMPP
jgi:site-specific DNA recombinase